MYYVVFAFLGAYSTVATTAIVRSAPARVTFLGMPLIADLYIRSAFAQCRASLSYNFRRARVSLAISTDICFWSSFHLTAPDPRITSNRLFVARGASSSAKQCFSLDSFTTMMDRGDKV